MTVKRPQFCNEKHSLNAMDPTEHFLRYAAIKMLAPGKRVLDIAFSKPYGSQLLREWGAREVIGVDVSIEAMNENDAPYQRSALADPHARLNPADCIRNVAGDEHFDLILCFDAIQRVQDPAALLRSVQSLAAPDAIILLTYPNHRLVTLQQGEKNSMKSGQYGFAEFKALAESTLGPVTSWLIGAKVQGCTLIPARSVLETSTWINPIPFLKTDELDATPVLPNQDSIRPDQDTTLFYMGVWGSADIALPTAISTQRDTQLAELNTAHDMMCSRAEHLQEEVNRLRRRLLALGDMVSALGTDLRAEQSRWHEAQDRADEAARRRDESQAELQRLLSTRGYRLLDFYYRLYRTRYIGGPLKATRGIVGKWLKRIHRR